ncbi:hypothetical protein MRB53_010004 [Persea americana]|uniref:Uncharacterized protein n=1 Tax=Persea americana TaxID=3435 RepID=A0ACC2LQR8_PERAE|nr:hypothetical protein MRB53_010004 [Persea americana]
MRVDEAVELCDDNATTCRGCQFQEAVECKDDAVLLKTMSLYGEEVVEALGSEVDRLEKEIQKIVPGIWHVDIEAHNPEGPSP